MTYLAMRSKILLRFLFGIDTIVYYETQARIAIHGDYHYGYSNEPIPLFIHWPHYLWFFGHGVNSIWSECDFFR